MSILLPISANAAVDENFPVLEGLYLNHVNSATPGKNLLVNPSFDLCANNIEAAVYVLTASDVVKDDCTKDVVWSWKVGVKGGAGYYPETSPYSPPNYTRQTATYKYVVKAGKTAELRAGVQLTDVSKLYISYFYQTASDTEIVGHQVKLAFNTGEDDASEVVAEELPATTSNTWVEGNYIHTFDTPYTGTVNVQLVNAGAGTEKIVFDDLLLTTETIVNPPAADEDRDGDGFSNDDEDAAGSDPDDAASIPSDRDGDGFSNDDETAKSSDPDDAASTPDSPDADKDEDGVLNASDKFIDNAAASMDSDDDGYPDEFNASCDTACQDASGLMLDAFPDEVGAYLDMTSNGLADQCSIELTGTAPDEYCGSIAVDYDNDEDGFSNAEEIAGGSNPNNASSTPTDTDNDGWEIDVDQYPALSMFSQATTNLFTEYGFDAESNTGEWLISETATIGQTIDRNGEETAAFKLTINNGEVRLDGPILEIAESKDARLLRIAAWLKIEDTTERSATDVLENAFVRAGLKYHDTEIKGGAFPGYYANQKSAENIVKLEAMYNNGWVYVESEFAAAGAILSVKPNLVLKTLAAGEVTLWVDNFEVNFAESTDSDGDLTLDALDTDDDNDLILDGVDESPLGPDAPDSDLDGIFDAYDDDIDNDAIANVRDDNFTPVFTQEISIVETAESFTLTAQAYDLDDENITYRWTIFTTDIAEDGSYQVIETELTESGNSIVINVADYPTGFQVPVSVVAITSEESAMQEAVIQIPGEKLNFVPKINESQPTSNNVSNTITIAADVFDFDEDDTLTYSWAVDGVAVENVTSEISINNADYAPGTALDITLTVTDGKDSVSNTWNVLTNSLPEVSIDVAKVDNDNTLFTIAYVDDEGNLIPGVNDVDGDSFNYTWTLNVDGVEQQLDEGSDTGSELNIFKYDYQAGSKLEVTVTVVDVNRPDHTASATEMLTLEAPNGDNDKEIYPEGNDGGATWWLLALLVPAFIRRRFNK